MTNAKEKILAEGVLHAQTWKEVIDARARRDFEGILMEKVACRQMNAPEILAVAMLFAKVSTEALDAVAHRAIKEILCENVSVSKNTCNFTLFPGYLLVLLVLYSYKVS